MQLAALICATCPSMTAQAVTAIPELSSMLVRWSLRKANETPGGTGKAIMLVMNTTSTIRNCRPVMKRSMLSPWCARQVLL